MAINRKPPCPAQTQQLKKEVSEKQVGSFPTLLCLLCSGIPLSPSIHWIQSSPSSKASLLPRSSLTCPLQSIIMWPCLRHRPNISHCCMAQFPAQNLSILPLNRWPCFHYVTCNSSLLPWGQASNFPDPVLAGTFPRYWPWLYTLEYTIPPSRDDLSLSLCLRTPIHASISVQVGSEPCSPIRY